MQATQQERMLADTTRAVAWATVLGQVLIAEASAGGRACADFGGRRPVNSQSIANHGAVAWKGDGREVQKPVCLHA